MTLDGNPVTANAIWGWLLLPSLPGLYWYCFVVAFFHVSAMSRRSVIAINSLAQTQLSFHQTCSSGEAGEDGGELTDWLNDKDK